jgi:hypothetical protein
LESIGDGFRKTLRERERNGRDPNASTIDDDAPANGGKTQIVDGRENGASTI